MAKRFLLCALFACSVAGTRASNNETCPSEACIRIAEEEYRGWPCEDGPNCTWTLLDLEFTVTKTEVGSGDDLNLTGISGGPFLYTKACRRFFLQYFDGINGSRAYNCSITNVKSLPDDVFTSDIIFCTISWLVEMSVLFHCWHQSRTTDEESDEVGDMAQITMLAGQACLGMLVMGVSLFKLFWWTFALASFCETRLCRKMLHNALLTIVTCGLGCCGTIAGALHDGDVAGHRAQTRTCPSLHRSPRVGQIAVCGMWVGFDVLRAYYTSPNTPALVLGFAAVAVQGILLAIELSLFYYEFSKYSTGKQMGERHQLLDNSVEMAQTKAV